MAGIFVLLGIWQLARNNHKHAIVSREKAAYAKPAPDVGSLPSGTNDGDPVQARGTFDRSHETVLRNQVRNDHVGVDVLTPLRLANGSAVLVDRGWVHASASGSLTTDPPPAGTAVVHGLLHSSNPFARGDTVNHLEGGRLGVPRVDLTAIGRVLPYPLKTIWIEARAITPTPTGNAPHSPAAASRSREPHGVRDRVVRVRADPDRRVADRAAPVPASAKGGDELQHREPPESTEPMTSRSDRVGKRASKP